MEQVLWCRWAQRGAGSGLWHPLPHSGVGAMAGRSLASSGSQEVTTGT